MQIGVPDGHRPWFSTATYFSSPSTRLFCCQRKNEFARYVFTFVAFQPSPNFSRKNSSEGGCSKSKNNVECISALYSHEKMRIRIAGFFHRPVSSPGFLCRRSSKGESGALVSRPEILVRVQSSATFAAVPHVVVRCCPKAKGWRLGKTGHAPMSPNGMAPALQAGLCGFNSRRRLQPQSG